MIDRSRVPRTVLMTTDTVGGVWTYAMELSRALAGRGIRVVLAAMGDYPTFPQRETAASIGCLTLESRPYKLEWMQDPWEDVERAGEWLLSLERAHRPEIIHLNGFAHGALPWSAPVLVVGHSCVWSWFYAVRGSAPGSEWETYRRRVRSGLKAADAVTAPTRAMLSELRKHYGSFRTPGAIYNARQADIFSPARRKQLVLTAGRLWDEAKNVNTLDAAAESIEWPVYAAGPVKNPDGGEIQFRSIRLLGCLSPAEMATWMGQASIYVLPARYEPFGLTVLEAALAGCALVLGDIPTLREVWRDAAIYVPPGDASAIASAVNQLAHAPDAVAEMAARARRRAERFTPARMSVNYQRLYAGMMTSGAAVRRDRPAIVVPQDQPSGSVERISE